jgi:hypothetical protein
MAALGRASRGHCGGIETGVRAKLVASGKRQRVPQKQGSICVTSGDTTTLLANGEMRRPAAMVVQGRKEGVWKGRGGQYRSGWVRMGQDGSCTMRTMDLCARSVFWNVEVWIDWTDERPDG